MHGGSENEDEGRGGGCGTSPYHVVRCRVSETSKLAGAGPTKSQPFIDVRVFSRVFQTSTSLHLVAVHRHLARRGAPGALRSLGRADTLARTTSPSSRAVSRRRFAFPGNVSSIIVLLLLLLRCGHTATCRGCSTGSSPLLVGSAIVRAAPLVAIMGSTRARDPLNSARFLAFLHLKKILMSMGVTRWFCACDGRYRHAGARTL